MCTELLALWESSICGIWEDRGRGTKEVGGEREKRRKATKGDGGDGRKEEGGGGEEEGGTIRVGKENKPSITMMAVPGACSLGSGSPLSRGQSCPPWRRGWNGCQGD